MFYKYAMFNIYLSKIVRKLKLKYFLNQFYKKTVHYLFYKNFNKN